VAFISTPWEQNRRGALAACGRSVGASFWLLDFAAGYRFGQVLHYLIPHGTVINPWDTPCHPHIKQLSRIQHCVL
jgi:hypothetical protein